MTFTNLIKTTTTLAICVVSSVSIATTQAFRYQGFNLMAFNKFDYASEDLVTKSVDYAVSAGSNFINIDWMVAVDDDGTVLPQTSAASFEPPLQDISRVIEIAHQRGLKVFLKPHVGFPDSPWDNRTTGNTDLTKFSLSLFFDDWTTYLARLGSVAAAMGVEGLVIATESSGFDSANRQQWLSLIATVRQVFPGKIAYGAGFAVQNPFLVTDVCFWDAVDIIGMSLYVALSGNDQATLQELNAAWHSNPYGSFGDIPEFLHSLSTKYDKPVMALEGGYQSIAGGLFNMRSDGEGRTVDNAVQAAGFASYLDTLGKYQGNWFWGLSIWTVYPPFLDPANQVGLGYTQGYMTNGKPAAEVIRNYFTGAMTYSDPTFSGGIGDDQVYGSYGNDVVIGLGGNDFLWGGAGDDTIVAGPFALSRATTASVDISAKGDVRASGGPKFRLLINGQAVSDWKEVTATQGTPAQNFGIAFPLDSYSSISSFKVESLPDPEFGSGVNRAIFMSAITVNGHPLKEADGTYMDSNGAIVGLGSWHALYSGAAVTQDVVAYQSYFFGSTTDDDTIVGGPGNDFIDGGTGNDVAAYSGKVANYTITKTAGGYTVTDNVGDDGRDTLTNVEHAQFADQTIALATFVPPTFSLMVSRKGTGSGTVTGTGINCGSDCTESYVNGTGVTLTATPNPIAPGGTYTFAGWGGDCASAGTQAVCTLTMSATKSVTATFSYIGAGSEYSRNYVQKAYVAYYGRPADPGGQGYWAGRMDAGGGSLSAIIGAFGYSDEFSRRYGGLTNTQLVTKIYQQALNRDPDPAGLSWYVGELQAGRRTLQTITLDVLNGATTAPDSTVVANKLDVAAYDTVKVASGCPYGTEQDGVNALTGVTSVFATVAAAKAAIDSRCGS